MTPRQYNPVQEARFRLPKYSENTTLDTAVKRLDFATTQFAIHHDIQYATEVSIAARRYVLALERYASKRKTPIKLQNPKVAVFFRDMAEVAKQFQRMRDNYERRVNLNGRIKKEETRQHIRSDYDTMGYYLTLLYDQVKRVANLTIPKNDNYPIKQ